MSKISPLTGSKDEETCTRYQYVDDGLSKLDDKSQNIPDKSNKNISEGDPCLYNMDKIIFPKGFNFPNKSTAKINPIATVAIQEDV